jgi:sugar lactone lactonase YvrE
LGPSGVAVDVSGNLFIADPGNNRIREVTPNGIITTAAGNGVHGYSGDSGPATIAQLDYPTGVAVDAFGDLFIADTYNERIRTVSPTGIITTLAGNGTYGYSGDGGAAMNASFSGPYGLAVDPSGNVYIADRDNQRVRKIDSRGIITTVAGDGTRRFSGDGGPATNASLAGPSGVAVDASGKLIIVDSGNSRIRSVNATQGPNLVIDNVSPGDAGNYQVVITDSGGSVTSSIATLTVATSPLIYGTAHQSGGNISIYFVSRPSSENLVLSATNLAPPVLWQPVSTNEAAADGTWQYTGANPAGGPARFFRSIMLNSP